MDFIADFAYRLPVTVICDMLGIPARATARCFFDGARAGGRLLDPVPLTRDEIDEANANNAASEAYFRALFELRRREPGDDLTTKLVQAEQDGDKLTNEELTQTSSCCSVPATRPRSISSATACWHCSAIPTSSRCSRRTPRSSGKRSRSCCATTARCSSPAAWRSRTSRWAAS